MNIELEMPSYEIAPITNLTVALEPVQDTSDGDPSPSNICPITGHSEVTVTRTGKNLLNESSAVTSTNNQYFPVDLKKNTDYTFSTDSIINGLYFQYSDAETRPATSGTWTTLFVRYNGTSVSGNSGSHKWYRLMAYEINGVTAGRKFQLELGSTATAYEPYQAQEYTIDLDGTIYGGTLDVLSGVLTVTHGMTDLTEGMTGGTAGSNYVFFKQLSNPKIVPNSQIAPIISERYVPIRYNGVASNSNTIAIRDNGTVYVNTGSQTPPEGIAVYKLATPTTVQLTAQEVETLIGINNVWSDSGDVTVTISGTTQTGDVVTVTALPQHKIQLFMP